MGKKKKKKSKIKKDLIADVRSFFEQNPSKQFNYKQVSHELGISDQPTRKVIMDILKEEVSRENLVEKQKGKFKQKTKRAFIEGLVDVTKKGAAFVITDELKDDVYIAPRDLGTALHNDEVRVHLHAQRKKGKNEGEVVEILKRAKTDFVGTVQVSKRFAFLVPDNVKMHVDIYIPLESLDGAKDGEKAIATITDWPEGATNPFGKITTILGKAGEHETEINSILAEYGLPNEFPSKVASAAEEIPEEIPSEEIKKRKDLRKVTTFTVDPEDAQDFDDAISFRETENGQFEVGIHIADVSHYVTPDTIIDKEAIKRATSVYLVDRVIPMLPEKLSNKVCSLRPDEDKLAFSAVFVLDKEANVKDQWFGKTLIRSDRRFVYDEAQAIIETQEGDLAKEVLQVNELAKKLRQKRIKEGSLEIESDEIKFLLDNKGQPLEVITKMVKEANLMIEDMMLLANRKVAEFIGKKEHPIPFIYRVHDLPDEEKIQLLKQFVDKFGYKLNYKAGTPSSYAINQLLKDVKNTPEEGVISQMAIRSMAKAVYSTENIGHYGLAFDYYTHFTSPIRRYPDLMVHRMLQNYLTEQKTPGTKALDKTCKHCSMMEKEATGAERDSIKYKQVEFMEDKIGKEFEGLITGITDWGIFIELIETKCEGMVRLKDIDDDLYYFDEKNYRITGKNKGQTFTIGDRLKAIPTRTDLLKKQMDLEISEFPKKK